MCRIRLPSLHFGVTAKTTDLKLLVEQMCKLIFRALTPFSRSTESVKLFFSVLTTGKLVQIIVHRFACFCDIRIQHFQQLKPCVVDHYFPGGIQIRGSVLHRGWRL